MLLKVKARDLVRRPSLFNTKEPIIVIDGNTKKPRCVVIPYEIYERFREEIESELFLSRNKAFALSEDVALDFKEREAEVVEALDD